MECVQLAHGFVFNYPMDTCTSTYDRIYLPMETCIMPMVNLYKATWKYGHSLKSKIDNTRGLGIYIKKSTKVQKRL